MQQSNLWRAIIAVAPIVTAGAIMHPRSSLAGQPTGPEYMKSDGNNCLGVRFGRVNQVGTELVVWDCPTKPQQYPDQRHWVFDTSNHGVLKNGNLCVGDSGPPAPEGTPLVLVPCGPRALQWTYTPNGQGQSGHLRSNHGLCLDAENGQHSEAVERTCSGGLFDPVDPRHKDQFWRFGPGVEL